MVSFHKPNFGAAQGTGTLIDAVLYQNNPSLRTQKLADFDRYMHVPPIIEAYLSADKSYRETRSTSNPLRPELFDMRVQHRVLHDTEPAESLAVHTACASDTTDRFQSFQQSDTWRQIALHRQGVNQSN